MARPLRIEYPGAWYHVMNRGVGQTSIFKKNAHRTYFLSLLADAHERYNAEWHAYCLLGNHFHLLVRTPEGNLQRIMRQVNGLYTQYFNRLEDKEGALFRGRYKAILVDAEAYWLQLSRYVHRNPLEAGLCERLEDYQWSSYSAYIGKAKPPQWLSTAYTLSAIGQRRRHAQYEAYVLGETNRSLNAFYERPKKGALLGDDSFKAKVLAGKFPNADLPQLNPARILPTARQIVMATGRYFGVESTVVWQSARGRSAISPARSVAMYLCQQVGGMRLSAIADAFGLASYASAGATVRQLKQRLLENKRLAADVKTIIQNLTPN